jgi:hypothetical protein
LAKAAEVVEVVRSLPVAETQPVTGRSPVAVRLQPLAAAARERAPVFAKAAAKPAKAAGKADKAAKAGAAAQAEDAKQAKAEVEAEEAGRRRLLAANAGKAAKAAAKAAKAANAKAKAPGAKATRAFDPVFWPGKEDEEAEAGVDLFSKALVGAEAEKRDDDDAEEESAEDDSEGEDSEEEAAEEEEDAEEEAAGEEEDAEEEEAGEEEVARPPRRAAAAAMSYNEVRHCHSTLSLTAIGCHSVGTYTVILRPLLSLSAEMRLFYTAGFTLYMVTIIEIYSVKPRLL